MHQDHNIPWHLLSKNLRLETRKDVTPRATDFYPRKLPNQASELEHFVSKFAATIRDFARTERAKYPDKVEMRDDEPLFSTALCGKHPEFLSPRFQSVQYWRDEAGRSSSTNTPYYNTSHGDFADVVKILLVENQMAGLLFLAQHPKVPLKCLHSLSWGHSFGFNRVTEGAIGFYVLLNLLDSLDLLQTEQWKESTSFQSLLCHNLPSFDYPAQQTPHQDFWGRTVQYNDINEIKRLDPLKDLDRLREYLKLCFAILYRYDMLCTELGIDPGWEGEIMYTMVFEKIPTETISREENDYRYVFK